MLVGYLGRPFRLTSVISEQSLFACRGLAVPHLGPSRLIPPQTANTLYLLLLLCPLDDPSLGRHFPSTETTHELGWFLIWLLLESVRSIHNFLSMFLFHWGFQISQPTTFFLTLYFEIIIALQEVAKKYMGTSWARSSPPLESLMAETAVSADPSPGLTVATQNITNQQENGKRDGRPQGLFQEGGLFRLSLRNRLIKGKLKGAKQRS